jgi:cytochrome c556
MIHMLSAIVVIGLAVSVATAQQNPIAARKALMKDNGDQAKIGAAMAKGEANFEKRWPEVLGTFLEAQPKRP